jgi:hypothetical protein
MVATKTQSLLSLLFEQEEIQPSFEESATERLEALKDMLEMFFASDPKIKEFESRGFEFIYNPGVVRKWPRDLYIMLLETLTVLIPGRPAPGKFGFYFKLSQLATKECEVNIHFASNPDPNEDANMFNISNSVRVMSVISNDLERDKDIILPGIKGILVHVLEHEFLKARDLNGEVALKVKNWLVKRFDFNQNQVDLTKHDTVWSINVKDFGLKLHFWFDTNQPDKVSIRGWFKYQLFNEDVDTDSTTWFEDLTKKIYELITA